MFLFDDRLHILGERRLEDIWPPWEALQRRRPVVDYTLALNYAIGGENPWSYHAVNLIVHVLAALALFGVVRTALTRDRFRNLRHGAVPWLAWTVALIWVVHPLQTQSVTYLVQRAESMMGLFYLLTLYCFARGATSARSVGWYLAATAAAALGMGCKAVMVTVPFVVALFDRVFLARSVSEMWRRRWPFYAGLVATWSVLLATGVAQGVLSPSTRKAHVGFGYKGIAPVEYLLTQAGVLVHYVRLSLWPRPLCFDYDWPAAGTLTAIALPGLIVVSALAATLWMLRRVPAAGFAAASFFVVLSPTSSFVPIKDLIFEHRMYLPLAPAVVLAVVSVYRLLEWFRARASPGLFGGKRLAAILVIVVAASLGTETLRRNRIYHSEAGMWHDVRIKQPGSKRAAENYGTALLAEGKLLDAMPALQEAVRIAPDSADVHNGLGFVLVAHGRHRDAVEHFRRAIELRPRHARARINLGNALRDLGRLNEAAEAYRGLLRLYPNNPDARLNLGNVFLAQGRTGEAAAEYRAVVDVDPAHVSAWGNLGFALLKQGEIDEAIAAFRKALSLNPNAANPLNGLGIALRLAGDHRGAIKAFQRAVQLHPDAAETHFHLGSCLLDAERADEALSHLRAAIRLDPSAPQYHFDLGLALERLGRCDEALEPFRRTLELRPDFAPAQEAIRRCTTGRSTEPGS